MEQLLDETHDAALGSWVPGALSPESGLPVQNLPLCIFPKPGEARRRIGVAIGAFVLDFPAALDADLLQGETGALRAVSEQADGGRCRGAPRIAQGPLDPAPAWGRRAGRGRRRAGADARCHAAPAERHRRLHGLLRVHPARDERRFHAPAGQFLPNYKWVPGGHHGRASTVVASGTPARRPKGQRRPADAPVPVFEPSQQLNCEAQIGAFIGPGSCTGEPVSIAAAGKLLFGLCLLNDWSARDIQAWEYQPLGPSLAKSFAATLSPWVVTQEALAPFREPRASRLPGAPPLLPYLDDTGHAAGGAFRITIDVHLQSAAMRAAGLATMRLSRADAACGLYWTLAQMVAYHTSNGCGVRAGDLIGSGTVSGDTPDSRGACWS